jgi:sulfur carrier protein ThiS
VKAKILKLGSAAFMVDIAPGSTIQDALDSASLRTEGYSLSLNGLGASTETGISEGDVITLIPKVVGGAAA